MSTLANFVGLHPSFKVPPGKIEEFKASLPGFVEKTKYEPKNLFYGFTSNGDEVFCREAEGLLAEAFKIADLTRIELPDPAGELEKLRAPLAHLNPAWFVSEGA